MPIMQLTRIQKITGRIVLKSGLNIGAGDTEMRIGSTGNRVRKDPHAAAKAGTAPG